MRISDWSSDVCSSDLPVGVARGLFGPVPFVEHQRRDAAQFGILRVGADVAREFDPMPVGVEEIDRLAKAVMRRPPHIRAVRGKLQIGKAACRESVCKYA